MSMNMSVVEALSSEDKLKKLGNKLKTEVFEVAEKRLKITKEIVADIKRVMPHCEVHVFGSQFTGLATQDSDFDIYIDYDGHSYFEELTHEDQQRYLAELEKKISTYPYSNLLLLFYFLQTARVPILRVTHTSTEKKCDINCLSGLSTEHSKLVKQLLQSDFRVSWLILVVRWWMKTNDLSKVNQFTSHVTTWLVLFFLMHVNVLGPLEDMKSRYSSRCIGRWDFKLDKKNTPRKQCRPNNDTRISLLRGFFRFYSTINFEHVVLCPLTGLAMPRRQFNDLNLPLIFNAYVKQVRQGGEKLKTDGTPVCLQDPFELSFNMAKGVTAKDVKKFQTFCQQSTDMCEAIENDQPRFAYYCQ